MRKSLEFNSRADILHTLRTMRRHQSFIPGVLVLLLAFTVSAKVIVVNTTNNVSPGPGQTNLVMAINSLADGDAIYFNIPGPGPFYLVTPPLVPDNGYPAITNHNVTIDGYTQPGSSPNSNTILSSNNANIQIVLDSRDGGARMEDIPGYGTTEAAVFFVEGATSVTFSGLCFLGPGFGSETDLDPNRYAISFALGADSGHVEGCWFGLDLDRATVYPFRDAVTGFQADSGPYINGTVIGVEKSAANGVAARAQFNILLGELIPIGLEGANARISGNFFNVFPDGLTDYNANVTPPILEAFIEIGGLVNNLVLGTDGDGVNDAEERNIFGGVTFAGDNRLLEFYGPSVSSLRTNIVIAGNYFGMAVDGVTRFSNSMKFLNGLNATSTARIGSDFDGISDNLEANFISMNYPFDKLFPTPTSTTPMIFADLGIGARLSMRGNILIGNNSPPFTFANRNFNRLNPFTNYFAPYLWTTNPIIPALSRTSTQTHLRGSCALGKDPYTNIIIDVYVADEEGWINGQLFQLPELAYTNSTGDTQYYGFAQGRAYLGSYVDNGPQDLDPTPGHFDFDVSSINIPVSELVTVTANYSADPPGTHNGRTHTSDFAMPIHLLPAPRMNITTMENNVLISWPTNSGSLTIQSAISLAPANWMDRSDQPSPVGTNYQVSLPISSGNVFFRLKY
jgi:hypothetical protein